jgi:ferritin-like metal-binding protein YciE
MFKGQKKSSLFGEQMAVKSIEKLFEHELKDIYFAEHELVKALKEEHELVKALKELEKEALDDQIKEAFAKHRQETLNQIKRLERVFMSIEKKAQKQNCAGILGLIKEKKDFSKEKPSKEILEVFNLTAAMKAQRYEISAYESLIRMANQMELAEAVEELEQNLEEEIGALEKLESFASEKEIPSDNQ